MSKVSRFLVSVSMLLFAALPVFGGDATKGNLVSAGWLAKRLGDPNVIVLDASLPASYAAQHIPGALNVDVFTYGVQERPLAETERLYQSWGLSPGKKVVVYDQGGSVSAPRVFFALYYHGYPLKDLFLLDGGLAKWQAEKLQVTKDVPAAPKAGTFRIRKVNEEIRVRLPEILEASGDPSANALVEALGANWHFGEAAPFGRPGHIPNGILAPSADFYNEDKTFKSPEELRRMADYFGIRPDQNVYTYCGGGVAASVPFFALKFLLGYPKVELYVESEMGWLADQRELPYWTYDAPYLLRDMRWVQSWGGKMMRTYAGARVSIVDVRPAAAFDEGHVPFALSIPAETFRASVTSPEKLAAVLGPAGVDPSAEAVVVSGAGLSKEAALAFVMLEKVGQKKVSVLLDPQEKWQPGVSLTKDKTIVAEKKAPRDLAIPPAMYPSQPRKDVVVADAKTTRGIYPKVFLASGPGLPANAQDGKVVHVPYTQLLNADGTPKAAKDIWNTLAKAGVPRYAEVVCVADDPAEAAVNYVILRLMGFPDVKVAI